MSITNELREYIKQTNWAITSKAKWFAIADRIDIEHEKAIRELNKLFRHHHELTVEDVLREFALEIDPSADIAVTGAEIIKKFAAKLRDDLETQRETAWHNTKRNAREYKRACDENDKLRELCKWAILCSEGDVRCEACPYHDKTREPHIICTMRKAAAELGIEVPV